MPFIANRLRESLMVLCIFVVSCGGGSGNSGSGGTSPTVTVPGAPTLSSVTAGDAQATVSFSAPSSTGGATITSYTATCTASGTSRSASGSASPLTVTGLANGTTYGCSVTATNSAGTGSPSSSTNVTPAAVSAGTGTSTAAPNGPDYVASCPQDLSLAFFDSSPIDLADFLAFRPLGFMSTPIHMFPAKHSAFSMTLPGQTAVPKLVKSPGKLTVTEIWEVSFSTGGKNYQIYLYPCREIRVYFGHLSTISGKLKTEFDKSSATCNSFNEGTATVTTCRRVGLNIPLESGETFGAGPDSAGVDFGTMDTRRTPAAFINLTHYDAYYPYWVSPLEFFAPDVRRAIEAKTGNVFGTRMRTALPIGGSHMQDLAGKAQGNWFIPGKYHSNSTDMSPMVALAHDYVDPTQPIMSAGSSIVGMAMGLYTYATQPSGLINRDFADMVSDGSVYCIGSFAQGQSAGGLPVSKPNGILILTLPTATTLKLELISAANCQVSGNWTFSNAATTMER